jgi:5-methylthioadenosine/S-adenosylhomocysteine deaminase
MMRASRFLLIGGLLVVTVWVLGSLRGQSATPVSLLISGGTIVTMDAEDRVLTSGAVAIDGDRIVEVGEADTLARKYAPADRIDARGQIVLPGLINTHTHAPMVLYRGLADDRALMDWLQNYIFPAEAKTVSPDFVRVGTRLAALEMIESGTTTFADMYYFEDDIAEVTREAGLRAVLGQSVIRFPVADAKTPEEGLARADAFISKWKTDALITPAVAPHAPHTVEGATLKAARELATRHGVPLLIHLAESQDEIKAVHAAHGTTPVRYLDSLGLWNGRSLAAHAVWLDDQDMDVLAKRGVGVAHNPESNMKLASGTAPVPGYLSAGTKLGLGTDGAASNNDLDMFESMRQAAFLHKLVSGDPRVVSAQQALSMATIGGARALGMQDRLGSLEAGKLADVIAIRTDQPRQVPMYDPLSHLVYTSRGDDVVLTIVNGKVLMRDGVVHTLNAAQVITDARAAADLVRKAVQ